MHARVRALLVSYRNTVLKVFKSLLIKNVRKNLFRNFSRFFTVQLSMFVAALATAFLDYQSYFRLSTTFFHLFQKFFPKLLNSSDLLLAVGLAASQQLCILSPSVMKVKELFYLFLNFLLSFFDEMRYNETAMQD